LGLVTGGTKGYGKRVEMFRRLAHAAVPNLDNVKSGQDRSFWRIAHQYLIVINEFENFRPFRAPRKAHLNHKVKPELLIAMLSVEQVQLGGETYRFQQRVNHGQLDLSISISSQAHCEVTGRKEPSN
jgi:hypothetical protein